MSIVSWILGHFPEILFVLLIGGVIGTLVDGAYSWFFEDDSWGTNALVSGGIALSVILPLITHLKHRGAAEDAGSEL
jgi:hypothetical protein